MRKTRKEKTKICPFCKEEKELSEYGTKKFCRSCNALINEWRNGRKRTKEEKAKYPKMRIHYVIPTYKKVYSLYVFDWFKYAKIFKRVQQLAFKYGKHIWDNTSPYRVLNLCYIRDELGELQALGDEKHIFRYKDLHKLYVEIAECILRTYKIQASNDVLNYLYKRTGIKLYYDKISCAEIAGTEYLSIKERFKIHSELLRRLYKGVELEEAIKQV